MFTATTHGFFSQGQQEIVKMESTTFEKPVPVVYGTAAFSYLQHRSALLGFA